MNNPYLFPALDLTPIIFAELATKLTAEQLEYRVDENHFSLREALCHIADFEPIFRQRIRNTIDRPNHTFQGVDPDLLAADGAYDKRDIKAELKNLRAQRSETIGILKNLSPEQWSISSVHAERGTMTIEDQANLLVGHDVYHIETFAKATST